MGQQLQTFRFRFKKYLLEYKTTDIQTDKLAHRRTVHILYTRSKNDYLQI